MTKAPFRLDTLLKLRQATRTERQVQLAEAYRALQVLEDRRSDLNRKLHELKEDLRRSSAPGDLDLDRLVQGQRYESLVHAETQMLTGQSKRIDEEIARRRHALGEADREVRILEKLRERGEQDALVRERRQEVKHLDEIAGRIRREES